MRRPQSVAVLIALMSLTPAAKAAAEGPVETGERRFQVPFRFDPARLDRLGAVEIRLYVSADRGRSWSVAATAAPGAGRFPYEAPGDGEYWFAVRTIDRRGQAHPDGPFGEPGLKVLVDRAEPVLELSLTALSDGAVGFAWRADDPTLDLGSLSLEFREGGEGPWMPVAVTASETGQTSWRTAAARVEVRGSVRDRLGNRGYGAAEIDLAAARPRPQPFGRPQPMTRPAADPFFPNAAQADPFFPNTAPSGPTGMLGHGGPDVPSLDFDAATFGDGRLEVPSLPSLMPDGPPAGPVGPGFSGPAASAPRGPQVSGPIASTPRLDAGFGFTAQPVSRPAASGPPVAAETFSPDPFFAPVPVEEPTMSSAPMTGFSAPSPSTSGERIVRDLDFEISYEVAEVGPSGVSAVEFYITDDGGRSWWTYGPDKDRVSPFVATVPREGRYGFTMRIRNGQGLGDDPPSAGDTPDVVVVVDRTPPRISLAEPVIGRGVEAGRVTFGWTVEEPHPAATAVALSYATTPQGPWQPITTWSQDAGRFVWAIEPGMPSRFYARVSVRDAAGNVGHAITRAPLTIDMQRPQARIIDIDARRTR